MMTTRAAVAVVVLSATLSSHVFANLDDHVGQLKVVRDKNGRTTIAIAISNEKNGRGEHELIPKRSLRFVLEGESNSDTLRSISDYLLSFKDNILSVPIAIRRSWNLRQGLLQDGGRSFKWNSKSHLWDETIILKQNASLFIDYSNVFLDQNPFFENRIASLNSRIKLAQSGLDSAALPLLIDDKHKIDEILAAGGTLTWNITEQNEPGSLKMQVLPGGKIAEITKELGGTSTLIVNFSAVVPPIRLDDSSVVGRTLADIFGSQISIENNGFIGIEIDLPVENDKITVKKVFPNSPSEKAGVQSGDILVSVNSVSLKGKDPTVLKDLVKGKKSVVLEIFRPVTSSLITLEIEKQIALLNGD